MAHSATEATEQASKLHPDIVFMDISMEYGTAGIDACKAIKENCSEIEIYFLTAYSKDVFEKELKDIKYDGFIDKMHFEHALEQILKANTEIK